ncbi:YsnF/AvaK domain-containing protein [Jeotgalibaca caeni]|uniref:YsnF/AvaK domain-containing protein n=1 Tax=Jeotgalibaca caeni TaxID=3028623 RepID=UPI00237DBE29|nr:YsnF/AvaK domain-containing protein [Jeotgalibaca caeni]MDE1548078.1 YsnF/AvaK domain-containing protein [Jeotgalibaca caeni]
MMNKRVEGSYSNVTDAMYAVERLHGEGYERDDITLVANTSVRETIPFTMDAEVTSDTELREDGDDDRSLWDKIKDAFTVDDYDDSRYDNADYDADADLLAPYRDDIDRGHIIVLVDGDAEPAVPADPDGYSTTPFNDTVVDDTTVMQDPTLDVADPVMPVQPDLTTTPDPNFVDDTYHDDTDLVDDVALTDDVMDEPTLTDDETLKLKEERLDVDTTEVQTGEVHIGKRVVEETETVEVPVRHEEITIERRPVMDGETTDGTISDMDETEEIVIPITEEQVDVSKHTEVVEEVDIHRDEVTEQKRVSDTVRREELDVDADGDVHVEGTDTTMDPTDELDRRL